MEKNDQFHISMQRSKSFQAEIAKSDPITAQQLMAAWREVIIEQFLKR